MNQQKLINDALSIIRNFDWYWRMCESNFNVEKRKAESQKNRFLNILHEIDDTHIIETLRTIWTIYYEMSKPYMDKEYYEERKSALKDYEKNLELLTEELITI